MGYFKTFRCVNFVLIILVFFITCFCVVLTGTTYAEIVQSVTRSVSLLSAVYFDELVGLSLSVLNRQNCTRYSACKLFNISLSL